MLTIDSEMVQAVNGLMCRDQIGMIGAPLAGLPKNARTHNKMKGRKKARRRVKQRPEGRTKGAPKTVAKRAGPLRPPKPRSTSREGGKRSYAAATLKQLFALSLNRCAYLDCTHEIVAAATSFSKSAVLGHICHIYASADNGPRGKPGLTMKERNAFENLILMCGHHHPLVDKQWETYPADLLKQWKATHEAKATGGTAEAAKLFADLEKLEFFKEVSDQEIARSLMRLRAARYLAGFAAKEEAELLAVRVERSRYSGGSASTRAQALAWCARILSQGDTCHRAEELLRQSRKLARTDDAELAAAFIEAETSVTNALAMLARIQTPAAFSAGLRIVTIKRGRDCARTWMSKVQLTHRDLDADGKFALLMNTFAEGDWTAVRTVAACITEPDFAACPALLHSVGMAHLLTAVPQELRHGVLTQIPFDVRHFPLASTTEALAERRTARALFARLAAGAQALGVTEAADICSDYELWLSLREPDNSSAKIELRESMSDPQRSLRRLNFALQFGLPVDLKAIEDRIDRSFALSEKGTLDEAFARFSLAFTKQNPAEIAGYIEKHRAQLYQHLNKQMVARIEIEILCRAMLMATARQRLEEAKRDGLGELDQRVLEGMVAEASGADPIAERRARYELTGALVDLDRLVDALAEAKLWPDMLAYAEKLFAATRSVEAYKQLVHCLEELGRDTELLASMAANPVIVGQSQHLRLVWARALYHGGRFSEARAALARVGDGRDSNARNLRVSIALASGEWDQVVAFAQDVWERHEEHTANELLAVARLSAVVKGPRTRDLVLVATEKEPNNPDVLVAAYLQASKDGWEHNESVSSWLTRAAELSAQDGPIQTVSMQELVERKPEWDRHAAHVVDQLRMGKVPTFLAVEVLKRSLLDLQHLPALTNLVEPDVRRRAMVFAFSGARSALGHLSVKTLALDLTAIITLAHLGVLDRVLSRYEGVVPHSTLDWLFEERHRATFHQPSRIRDAAKLKQLIGNGTFRIVRSSTSIAPQLAGQVGADLAALLTIAKERAASGARAIVVWPARLHRLGDLMDEQADLSGYEAVICSCAAFIDHLKSKAALTRAEEQKARDYLRLHERPWPQEAPIDDQAEIYIDELALSLLHAAGVLPKLRSAGLRAFIVESVEREAQSLLETERFGEQQLELVEQVRKSLATGMASGRVRAAARLVRAQDDPRLHLHPSYGVLSLTPGADAIVVDDRYINSYPVIATSTPVLCSLDVLALLHASGEMTVEELFGHRTTLRQAGYQLIAVSDDELQFHLKNASIVNGRLVESAELRAIRESLLRARMSAVVQLPQEAPFIHQTFDAYTNAIRGIWVADLPLAEAIARADYALAQMDVRKWAASALQGTERLFASSVYASHVLRLASPPQEADPASKVAYSDWIARRLLKPLKEYDPEVYKFVLSRCREIVIGVVEDGIKRELEAQPRMDPKPLRRAMFLAGLEWVPTMVRDDLLSDVKLQRDYGLTLDAVVNFGHAVAFKLSRLFLAVRAAIAAPRKRQKISDQSGKEWVIGVSLSGADSQLTLRSGADLFGANHLLLLGEHQAVRRAWFAAESERVNLPSVVRERWMKVLSRRALLTDEFDRLSADLAGTPVARKEALSEQVGGKNIALEMLVPKSLAYYEQLVGRVEGQAHIEEYTTTVLAGHVRQLLEWRTSEGLQHALLCASHSAVVRIIAEVPVSAGDFASFIRWATSADAMTRGATLELALQRRRTGAKIAAATESLARGLTAADGHDPYDPYVLLTAAFVMVYGELAKAKVLVAKPCYWRRVAALAQAALIVRSMLGKTMDLSRFLPWMVNIRSAEFNMQCQADLRTDPRWLVSFASPSQLKNEIGGRVWLAAHHNQRAVDRLGLRDILLGDDPSSLVRQLDLIQATLPGPLEGNLQPPEEATQAQIAEIRERLTDPVPTLASLLPIASLVPFKKLPEDIPGLVVELLRRARYRLDSPQDPDHLPHCLMALALLAAVNRHMQLADGVFAVIKVIRRFSPARLPPNVSFRIGMIACASRNELEPWCKCVGEFINDLAFGEFGREQAADLLRCVTMLSHLVPELWSSCGQGIAALESLVALQ